MMAEESAADDATPTPLAELLEQLPKVAAAGRGMDANEEALAQAFARHGRAAADPLVALLESEDPEIYQLVTYCLVALKKGDFEPRHLEPMAKAARKKRDWLPNAIADIDSDEAAAFLAKDFRRQPETMAQIDNALERMAPRSIAPMLIEFRDACADEAGFLDGLAAVFRDCGQRAASAVEPLTEIALDSVQPVFRRQTAIRYLGAIGPSSRPSFPRLLTLAEQDAGAFAKSINLAIADSRTPEAADFLIEAAITEARTTGKLHKFSTLATEVGQAGKHLAERLIALLDDPDPNVRLAACRTLGYLGDLNAWPHLCRMLKAEDWRIAYSAALSLTQLKALASRPSLKFCRDHYWYPRVRYAADFALRRLAEVDATKADRDRLGPTVNAKNLESAFGTFDFHDGQLRPLDDLASIPGLTLPAKDAEMKDSLYFARPQDPEIAKRDDMQGSPDLTLPREQELAQARQSVYAGIPSLQTNHPPLYQAIVQGAPEAIKDWKNVGLFGPRVIAIEYETDTTFVAIAAGEWYGGLFVIEPGQNARWIFKDFLKTLLRWNGHLITLSGMSHMGMDYGTVHRVVRDGTKWKTEFLYALPGCPQFGSVLADGRLFANCEGGAVAISPNGKFEFLGSGQKQEPDSQLPESPK